MKKYRVIVRFDGAIGYDVEAENAEDAEEKAFDLFDDEYDSNVVKSICNTDAESEEISD